MAHSENIVALTRWSRSRDLELGAAIAVVVLLTDPPPPFCCTNYSRIARHVVVRAGS
jgi:hypothetical protein